jgi:cardiolipin synthase C
MKLKSSIILLSTLVSVLVSCNQQAKETAAETKTDFCSQIHNADSSTLQKELEPVKGLMQTKTGVYVLEDGDGSMVTRAWLSEHAQKTIDVQYFIFTTDNVGLIACDYLVRAADRGVKVRILVDDIMVEASEHEILMMDSHKNIDIKIYNTGVNVGKNLFQKLKTFGKNFNKANQRMHNKTFTVDEQVGITGGRNIADEYFDYDHEYNFRDRDVLLLGNVVKKINKSFNNFWNDTLCVPVANLVSDTSIHSQNNTRFNKLHEYACNPENFWPQVRTKINNLPNAFKNIQQSGKLVWIDSVDFISDIPGKFINGNVGGGITTSALMQLISNAKKSINIQSPYLITTNTSKALFTNAVKRGVAIKILTNSLCSTDNLEAFAGYQKSRTSLLQAGVQIFEFKPNAVKRYKIMTGALQKKLNYTPIFGLHAKSMVIDDNITVIGTFNLDPRSANYNTECFAVIYNNQIAKSVLEGMNEEFLPENAWQTTLTFNPDGFADKTKRLKTWTKKIVPKAIL